MLVCPYCNQGHFDFFLFILCVSSQRNDVDLILSSLKTGISGGGLNVIPYIPLWMAKTEGIICPYYKGGGGGHDFIYCP